MPDLLLMMITAPIAAQQLVLDFVQVRQLFLFRADMQRRLFAFVAGDQPLAVRKHIDGQRAVVRAAVAYRAFRSMGNCLTCCAFKMAEVPCE